MKKLFFVAMTGLLVFSSCKKEEIEPTEPDTPTTSSFTLIGTATNTNNETIKLYASKSSLNTGYNKLWVEVKDAAGNAVTNATVTFAPLMDMGSMQHSSPVEHPVYKSTLSKYEGVVVFTMSSMSGTWTLDVLVNGTAVTFPLTIGEAPTKVVGSYMGTNGTTYIVTLVPPSKWNVGMNDLEIMIHRKASMMDYPTEETLTTIFEPEMVSMSHGSPNNVSPVHIGNGHYKGVANLTMTGDWRFHFELYASGVMVHSDAYLDILF